MIANQDKNIKTIFIAIAFGTSVRDVLRNDTYKKLKNNENLEIVVLAQNVSDPQFINEFSGENIHFEPLQKVQPTVIERALLQFHRATLRHKCKTIDLGNTSGDKRVLNLLTPFARFALFLLGEKRLTKTIKWIYEKFTPSNYYEDVFEKYLPELVVVTRVLNYSLDYPVLRAAAFKGIPTVSLVSSWDNLTSKGFFPFSIKKLVVWNEIIKDEAIDLFNFPNEKILISGIPRYDIFFQRKDFREKSAFFNYKGLDVNKKLITYCTGSMTTGRSKMDQTSPEPEICTYIAQSIEDNQFSDEVQFLVRLHPQADAAEYEELINRENIILHIPGRQSSFQDRFFSFQDDIEFGETMLYSDVVINLASTVTIDAAVFDTPIVAVNFDYRGIRPYEYSVKRFYDFDHYKKLRDIGGFKLSDSKEEMITDINKYLDNPRLDQEGRKEIVKRQCHFNDGKSGERVADFILDELSHESEIRDKSEVNSYRGDFV